MNGAVIYRGPSMLDSDVEIVAIVTGLTRRSANIKTGAMLQTWILRTDVAPHDAVRSGADAAVCGDCRHRGTSCYVTVHQAPLSVWKALQRGRYPTIDSAADLRALGEGRSVRIGSYGDPAAVPAYVWHWLTFHAAHWTGYTHQWHTLTSARADTLRRLVMASVDTPQERQRARLLGWRTFRVRKHGAPLMGAEVACPASDEAGHKSACERCGLCSGVTSKARVSVAIEAHGSRAHRFTA